MNSKFVFEDIYEDGVDKYYKRVDVGKGVFEIKKNEQELSLADWNAAVNRIYPMALKEKHGLSLVRMKENMRQNFLVKNVLQAKPKVVADVGTEAGHIVKRFLDRVDRVYCVDLDENMVKKAVEGLNSPKVKGVVSPGGKLDLPDNSVDVLLAASILEHTPEPADAVKEFKRVVKPGGVLILSVPNDLALVRIKKMLLKIGLGSVLGALAKGLAMGHISVFSIKSFVEIAKAGGKIVKSGYMKPFCLDIYAIVEVID